ncbi:MAG: Mrp/NBP35 family ATP-binding protein [Candidatus Bathyarchaeota archaeon]|nr:Mrp/NBP35 family ATP-binding protein [Candidatus Bathyarchaeota archaeon]
MNKIKHKIAVISGKGGVGKSTITANLAAAFAAKGKKVGVLDADIHGPSIPRMFGLDGKQVQTSPMGVLPVVGPLGVEVMSIDFFMPSQTPAIWRGPLKMRAIRQFLTDIVWGDLDILFIDLPPGTGDEPLSVAQLLPEMDGVIIVTMPSDLSRAIVEKAIVFAARVNMPVIGVVENMSGFVCPHCGEKTDIFQAGGGKKITQETGTSFLGSIPIDPKVSLDSDKGSPFVLAHKDSVATKEFTGIVEKIDAFLNKK